MTAIVDAALEGLASLTQQDFAAVGPKVLIQILATSKKLKKIPIIAKCSNPSQVRAVKQPSPSIKITMEAICLLRSETNLVINLNPSDKYHSLF